MLGEQYIGLIPGGDDKMLQNGDEFKKTQSAVVLEDLIGKFFYLERGCRKVIKLRKRYKT